MVTRVARGDDAAALDLDTPFDVAVLDRMLPGIYGVAVVAQSESLA
ncbi:response regulator transcription factor [Sphingomonas sp. OK281]|nr:response regulator transcription factor [Sphingomonas sp. OK281]